VALLRNGLPEIDPMGAQVGGFRTMVEAVAMRTTGLGGDSEVHVLTEGLAGGLRLGPRRLIPVSLLAQTHGDMVHAALDRALSADAVGEHDGRFVVPMGGDLSGLSARESGVLNRITGPMPLALALTTRLEVAAMDRLVARGLVMLAGVTPSDASHERGILSDWDAKAAHKALTLLARRRNGRGERIASGPQALADAIVTQLTDQTTTCLLEAAFAEDPAFAGQSAEALARHGLTQAGLRQHKGVVQIGVTLGVPVIGLGASAPFYYGAVGEKLGATMILPEHAGVANAIGAVVGQISQRATGLITSAGEGNFVLHHPEGLVHLKDRETALTTMQAALIAEATDRALRAGAADVHIITSQELREAEVEGRQMFIEATLTATASGRPRVAHNPAQDLSGAGVAML
jgi:N-methylhydantoinase A/oxoprolinase/acetone carboxylase beta subunit